MRLYHVKVGSYTSNMRDLFVSIKARIKPKEVVTNPIEGLV